MKPHPILLALTLCACGAESITPVPAVNELIIGSGNVMLCPGCKKDGAKSKVYPGMSTGTLLASMPYYDEDGKLQGARDPNTYTTSYRCSRGHEWSVSRQSGEPDRVSEILMGKPDEPPMILSGTDLSLQRTMASNTPLASSGANTIFIGNGTTTAIDTYLKVIPVPRGYVLTMDKTGGQSFKPDTAFAILTLAEVEEVVRALESAVTDAMMVIANYSQLMEWKHLLASLDDLERVVRLRTEKTAKLKELQALLAKWDKRLAEMREGKK